MKIPSRYKFEYALEVLRREIDILESCIRDYPDDPDALPNGGWTMGINGLRKVINWIKCRECVVRNGTSCEGSVEIQTVFMGQLEIPVCTKHYQEIQQIKVED